VLLDALNNKSFDSLQHKLMEKKALTFLPTIYFIEKNGYKLWGNWARIILKKGPYNSPQRDPLLRLFQYYLFFVLYVVSPFGLLFFYLTYPFRIAGLRKAKNNMCYELKLTHLNK
jgi:hypothetical protein